MEQATLNPKSKVFLVIAVVVIVLLAAGYVLWQKSKKTPEEKAAETVEKTLESAVGGTLPELSPLSNPLEKLPEINPVEKANPFKGLQTNPFK